MLEFATFFAPQPTMRWREQVHVVRPNILDMNHTSFAHKNSNVCKQGNWHNAKGHGRTVNISKEVHQHSVKEPHGRNRNNAEQNLFRSMTSKPRILTFDVANSRRRTYWQIKKERLTVRVSTNGQFGMEVEFPSRQHRDLLEAGGAQSSHGRDFKWIGLVEVQGSHCISYGSWLACIFNILVVYTYCRF